MKNYPVYLRNMLNSVIREMTKYPEMFCRNPGKDFFISRTVALIRRLATCCFLILHLMKLNTGKSVNMVGCGKAI